MLDGLEYLLVNNDFSRLLKFIEYINELVMQNSALLLISIDQRALDEREMALLERNAVVA
jgi:archaellum biogenesis ATPase FlaH